MFFQVKEWYFKNPSQALRYFIAPGVPNNEYFIYISLIIVAHASDFFLWNSQTVGLYIYALEGLECLGQYRALAGYRDQWEP